MTDINLLRDREFGDQSKEEGDKQKRKSETVVTLTNPVKGRSDTDTIQPVGGAWASIKSFFSKLFPSSKGIPGKVRILHEEVHVAEPEAPRKKPRRKIKEEYVPASGEKLEDVFANPQERSSVGDGGNQQDAVATDTPAIRQPGEWPNEESHLTPQSPSVVPDQPASAGFGEAELPPENIRADNQPRDVRQSSLETSLGVNLVPEEMRSNSGKQNRIIALMFFAMFSVIAVALIYVVLAIFQQRIVSQIETNQEQILARDQELVRLTAEKKKALDFHRRTLQVLGQLDTHIYWTKFLSGLEKYTVDTVSITSMSADQAGRLNINARGKDFRSVSRQLIAFEEADDFVKTVSITAASSSEVDGVPVVEFAASITLVDDVLYRDSTGGPEYTFE